MLDYLIDIITSHGDCQNATAAKALNQLTLPSIEGYISSQRALFFQVFDNSAEQTLMSQTLGEKLRQAREAKGISVSEVAEQTRIAPLYIESIDNDDYRALPGGIFNRGFIKSYARYVSVDEAEALADYARLLNDTEGNDVEEVKTYNPQVLTDDRQTHSMVPTIIVAIVVLGLMTGVILFLVNYFSQPALPTVDNHKINANVNSVVETVSPVEVDSPSAPEKTGTSELPVSSPISGVTSSNSTSSSNTLTAPASHTSPKPSPEKPKPVSTAVLSKPANSSTRPINKAPR
jgi:cytoskeletal protein RodZ